MNVRFWKKSYFILLIDYLLLGSEHLCKDQSDFFTHKKIKNASVKQIYIPQHAMKLEISRKIRPPYPSRSSEGVNMRKYPSTKEDFIRTIYVGKISRLKGCCKLRTRWTCYNIFIVNTPPVVEWGSLGTGLCALTGRRKNAFPLRVPLSAGRASSCPRGPQQWPPISATRRRSSLRIRSSEFEASKKRRHFRCAHSEVRKIGLPETPSSPVPIVRR